MGQPRAWLESPIRHGGITPGIVRRFGERQPLSKDVRKPRKGRVVVVRTYTSGELPRQKIPLLCLCDFVLRLSPPPKTFFLYSLGSVGVLSFERTSAITFV
jgi:hypothetical protein